MRAQPAVMNCFKVSNEAVASMLDRRGGAVIGPCELLIDGLGKRHVYRKLRTISTAGVAYAEELDKGRNLALDEAFLMHFARVAVNDSGVTVTWRETLKNGEWFEIIGLNELKPKMMQTCSLFLGVLHSAASFCTPTPDDDRWQIADYISLASAIATALGVLTALAAAILVPYFQTQHLTAEGLKKEKAEIRSFVRAIRAEVSVTWSNYGAIRPQWDSSAKKMIVRQTFLFSDKSFAIYDNAGAQIGRVPDIRLQESIVETYSLAKSLILTFYLNNGMLKDLGMLEALPLDGGTHIPEPRKQQIETIKGDLAQQAETLRELDGKLERRVKELVTQINDFLVQF